MLNRILVSLLSNLLWLVGFELGLKQLVEDKVIQVVDLL